MKTLSDILLAPHQKDALFADIVQLIESHVASLSGLKGMTFKTAVGMLKAAKPGILERAVAILVPAFTKALEPLHQQFRTSGDRDFSVFLQKNSRQATQALLGVADARIAEGSSGAKSVYGKLRGSAEAEVLAVMPRLSKLLSGYL